MHTIAIVNQKGGCGKTTTAINLAGVFAGRGHRTLLVDMDPQSHCAAGLAIPENRIDLNIGDALLAGKELPVDAARLLWRVSRNLDLAPSSLRLAALEASRGELAGKPDAEQRLAQVLARFDSQYDVCLIDCSPAIGLLAFNAIVAADEIMVPVETGFFSLQGATKQINTIKSIGKRLGVAPGHRVLATMHEPSSMLSKDLLEELRRRFGNRVIPVVIRFDQALREAASFGQPVIEYAPESSGAQDYQHLADWLTMNSLHKKHAEHEDAPEDWPATPAPAPAPTIDITLQSQLELARLGLDTTAPPAQPLPASRAADVASRAMKRHAKPADLEPIINGELSAAAGAVSASMVEVKVVQADLPEHAAPTPSIEPAPAPSSRTNTAPTHTAPSAHWPTMAYGPQVTPHGVIFRAPASIGRSVAVAGDFNQWMPERTPMRLSESTGTLEAVAFMPPGSTSQYRLVVDGSWVSDPYNPSIVPNPFGGSNSLVSVPLMMAAEIVVPAASRASDLSRSHS